jgi:glycosyltransferase involved in cell wall biosynthesis
LLNELRPDIPLFDLSRPVPASRLGLTGDERGPTGEDPPGGFNLRSVARLVPECRRLDRVLELTRTHVVSSFLMRSHLIALLTKRLLRPSLRIVINVHEHMSESAHHLYPSAVDRMLMRWVTRNLFPQADRIVVVADSLRQDLTAEFGVPASLISVVRNPIDLREIRSRALEEVDEQQMPRDQAPTVVAVGRLVNLKGFDILIRAFARLPAEIGARLVIVGGGPDRNALESLAAELGLSDRIRFVGWQKNPWKFMARAHVFAMPSRTEAFPSVVGEALALGIPVVAADCSAGVREYLDGSRLGLVVPPEDDASLAGALERMLSDAQLRETFAERGLPRMAELDVPVVVRAYEQTLAHVIAAAPPAMRRLADSPITTT